jgi:hypothetical protein
MRRILVLTGVLGGGTAVVFALAALTSALFPNGTTVTSTWGASVGIRQQMNWVNTQVAPAEDVPAVFRSATEGGVPIGGSMVVADDGTAGGFVTIRIDENGNPILDADGNPIVDNTGPQP